MTPAPPRVALAGWVAGSAGMCWGWWVTLAAGQEPAGVVAWIPMLFAYPWLLLLLAAGAGAAPPRAREDAWVVLSLLAPVVALAWVLPETDPSFALGRARVAFGALVAAGAIYGLASTPQASTMLRRGYLVVHVVGVAGAWLGIVWGLTGGRET